MASASWSHEAGAHAPKCYALTGRAQPAARPLPMSWTAASDAAARAVTPLNRGAAAAEGRARRASASIAGVASRAIVSDRLQTLGDPASAGAQPGGLHLVFDLVLHVKFSCSGRGEFSGRRRAAGGVDFSDGKSREREPLSR